MINDDGPTPDKILTVLPGKKLETIQFVFLKDSWPYKKPEVKLQTGDINFYMYLT